MVATRAQLTLLLVAIVTLDFDHHDVVNDLRHEEDFAGEVVMFPVAEWVNDADDQDVVAPLGAKVQDELQLKYLK